MMYFGCRIVTANNVIFIDSSKTFIINFFLLGENSIDIAQGT